MNFFTFSLVFPSSSGPIPDGADAVVQVEDTEEVNHTAAESKRVKILVQTNKGVDIRPVVGFSLSLLSPFYSHTYLGFYVNWYTTFSPLDYTLYGLVVSYMCIKLQMLDSIPAVKTALIQGFRSCVIFCLKDVMP